MKKLVLLLLMLCISTSTLQAQCANQYYIDKTMVSWNAHEFYIYSQAQFDAFPQYQSIKLLSGGTLVKVPTASNKNVYEYWTLTSPIEDGFTHKSIIASRRAKEPDFDNLLKLSGATKTVAQSLDGNNYMLANNLKDSDVLCQILKNLPCNDGYDMLNGYTINFTYLKLGNEEFETSSKIQITPNPSKDHFSLNIEETLQYRIFDLQGREVLSGISLDEDFIISHNLPAGMYIVNAGNVSKKLIVQ